MKKALFVLIVFCLCAGLATGAEQKPLKPEDVLKLKNLELSLQNLELQMELIRRDLEKVRQERDSYLDEFHKAYGVGEGWRIDLEKGIWFREQANTPEKKEAQPTR
jgi:hypothetical protein